jgi:SAM-dependent methyltransferase
MKTLKEYWNASFQRSGLKPAYDDWLDKYEDELKISQDAIVDLGCGTGNNALYLYEKGIYPLACDVSEEAIRIVKAHMPDIGTKAFDMSEGLPFESGSVKVLIADLSLHYFNARTTRHVIKEIHRVLTADGLFLCRLNSTKEIGNKGEVSGSAEQYLLENEGIQRRFFNRDEIDRFFTADMWSLIHADEYELQRYANKKMLWELAMRRM